MTTHPGRDPVPGRPAALSRRSCVHGAIAFAIGAPLLTASVPGSATAADKATKKLVSYQDQPKGKAEMCATCKFFMPPASCLVVEGTISPQGWCQRYQKRS